MNGGLSMPSITTSSWFSASWPCRRPSCPGRPLVDDVADLLHPRAGRRARAPARAARTSSRARRGSRSIMSPLGLIAPIGPKKCRSSVDGVIGCCPSAWRRMPTASISSMKTMHWPPHLRASFFALRARKRTISASMPMNVCAKPEPGIETNGELKPGRDRLREHRLAGARRAEEEQASLALAAGALERLARLPERDDAAHLLLRLCLAADVVELHAPLGVAGLVAADLRDAHQHHRAHEDQEVRQEEEEDEDHLDPEAPAVRRACPIFGQDAARRLRPRHVCRPASKKYRLEEEERDDAPRRRSRRGR